MAGKMKQVAAMLLVVLLIQSMIPAAFAEEAATQLPTEISADTVWSYLDDGTDPAGDPAAEGYVRTSWTASDFDDSDWKTGAGPFGAQEGAALVNGKYTAKTVLEGSGISVDGNISSIPAYFFRTKIQIDDPESVAGFKGNIEYDDGIILYINGIRVAAFDDSACDENGNSLGKGFDANLQYGGSNQSARKKTDFSIDLTDEELSSVLQEGENTVAVELHQGKKEGKDIWFYLTMEPEEVVEEPKPQLPQSNVCLTPGTNESQMNFTWYAQSSEAGTLLIAKNDDVENGQMPDSAVQISAVSSLANDGNYSNKAVATNLESGTTYAYQLVNGDVKSDIYTFTTAPAGTFSFTYLSDIQIGGGTTVGSTMAADIEGWTDTLNIIATNNLFSGTAFILSGGDQVDRNVDRETAYDGLLDHPELKSIPLAPAIGNHETTNAYAQHYNLSNVSSQYGKNDAGADAWFVYNDVLFLILNSNDSDEAEHKAFMEAAITENPDVDWTIAVMHHSLYSGKTPGGANSALRGDFVPVFDELGIDLVLMGHDHVYCRTYIMDGLEISQDEDYTYGNGEENAPTAVTNPNGVLYITANSASGSKFFDITVNGEFAAVQNQNEQPNISKIVVSENQLTVTTYQTNDMAVVDAFSILRSEDIPAAKTLDSIAITTPPTKTAYIAGEPFDSTGMVVTATYSDTSTTPVTGYAVSPAGALSEGDEVITVTYTEDGVTKTATQTITVTVAHEHTFATTWSYDTNHHWYAATCSHDVKSGLESHHGGTATCAARAICVDCGQFYGDLADHTESGWKYDNAQHWKICTVESCGEILTAKEDHAYGMDRVCDTCGYTKPASGRPGSGGGGISAYAITVKDTKKGEITSDYKSASAGTTITLTIKPDKGYALETLIVTDDRGKEVKVTEKAGKYTFKMPASKVIVEATFMDDNTMLNYFVDVFASDYYYDAVLWAAENGITSGTDAVHFSPKMTCTRAQAATFLWRAAGSPEPEGSDIPFADVAAGAYYYKAVLWAVENGITNGTSATAFSPNAECTRAQIVTFLWRAQKSPVADAVNPFTDVTANAYYADAALWAVMNSVTNGTTATTFSPDADCTRAQIVTFLYRCMGK